MMQKLSYHNAYGQIVTYPIKAEITDDDGRVFYVVGPVPLGMYDTRPPYDVIPKDSDAWRHE